MNRKIGLAVNAINIFLFSAIVTYCAFYFTYMQDLVLAEGMKKENVKISTSIESRETYSYANGKQTNYIVLVENNEPTKVSSTSASNTR